MREQISGAQFISLMVWLIIGTGVMTLPTSINEFVHYQDGWITTLLMMAVPLVLAAIATFYVRIAADQDFFDLLRKTFGRVIGMLLIIWVFLWLYICSATITREICVFIEINFLPRTPMYVISALLVLTTTVSVYYGIETLGRMSLLISFVSTIGILTLILFLGFQVHPENFAPLLTSGWHPVIESTFYPWAFFSEIIIAFFILPSVKKPGQLPKYLLIAGGFVTLLALIIEGTTISSLGKLSEYASYPVLTAIRGISIGVFLQRFEPLYVVTVMGTVFIKLSVFQYAYTRSAQAMCKVNDRKWITWSLGLVMWEGSMFFFHNSTQLTQFVIFTFPSYTITVSILLPIILIAGMKVRNKLKQTG